MVAGSPQLRSQLETPPPQVTWQPPVAQFAVQAASPEHVNVHMSVAPVAQL